MTAISKSSLVRLIASVIGLIGSVWFVVNYTKASQFRFKFEYEGGQLNAINSVLVHYSTWLYVLPVISIALGLWGICRRSHPCDALEILISAAWLLALGLAGFCRETDDDLRPEYDLAKLKGGVRGKYAKQVREGTNFVLLSPDVAAYFPTEESVNFALRSLVEIVSDKLDPVH